VPLNEASAPRSYLTRAQKREALAAIYGLPTDEPSDAELDELRELLAQLHKENTLE
jgi:hypothetical protein